jgi:hypothetical protein
LLVVSLLQEDNRGADGEVAGHTHISFAVCCLLSYVSYVLLAIAATPAFFFGIPYVFLLFGI